MKVRSLLFRPQRKRGASAAESRSGERPAPEPYKPLFEIGRGGMGVVSVALARGPEGFEKLVVLKRLHEHLMADPDSVRMLLEEARISARLAHPNVVQVYEATMHSGAPTIVMEYLEGLPLPVLAQAATPLPTRLHLSALLQVLRGLDAAHELVDFDGKPLHLVHRDMSPHNVFVGYDGVVKVLDFGIAKIAGSDQGATRTGVLKGKLRYMAPEQVAGGELDRRTDLFSVGVMLWEAIAGRRLWGDTVDGLVVGALLAGNIPALPTEDIDPKLRRVCARALAADPSERYSTAVEFRRDLQAYLDDTSGELVDEGLSEFLARHFAERRDALRARIAERIRCATSPPPPSAGASSRGTEPTVVASAPPRASSRRILAAATILAGACAALALLLPSLRHPGVAAPYGPAVDRAAAPAPALDCGPGLKSCSGRCVSSERPEYGCGSPSCSACLRANATSRCGRDGACTVAVCYRGYDDCDGVEENGCETFLRTDPDHCGSCTTACPALPHALVGCGDACRIWRCEVGYEDCNGVGDDGCEVDVNSDRSHCGACGQRCRGRAQCQHGRCVP
jgi:serine/threonine protein kinase